jgi:hypothetical protein
MKKIKTDLFKKFAFGYGNYGIKGYPFAEKEAKYRAMTPEQLIFNLKDAKEAYEAQSEIEDQGGRGVDKDAGWRADDVHTILKIIQERGINVPPEARGGF